MEKKLCKTELFFPTVSIYSGKTVQVSLMEFLFQIWKKLWGEKCYHMGKKTHVFLQKK